MPDTVEIPTKSYSLTLEASVTVPADVTEVLAFDGRVVGFTLADGSVVKPCIVFERASSAENDDYKDLNDNEAMALGLNLEYEHREMVEELD